MVALALGVASLLYATVALAVAGPEAFRVDTGGWLQLSGPITALGLAPLFLVCGGSVLRYRVRGGDQPDARADVSGERERLLRHAMRVETVGDLASMVAHHLRNHLQIMMGHATLGADEGPAERARRLATIREEVAASIRLLEQLLELAHPGEEPASCVDLVEICSRFGERMRGVLPSAIDFELRLPDARVPVMLDPRGLEHALLNLVLNAHHAITERGQVVVALRAQSHFAEIEVSDTGTGIPATVLARVFEPYFTTKPKGKGTGLGLAAVERYVRASAGRIEVESEVGRGTTFRMAFPLVSA
jgi:signal transduction histidine kinase